MKTTLRLPPNFTEYPGDPIVSNLDSFINDEIANSIKGQNEFSRYSAWHFNGKIWWNDEIGYWCGKVWQFNNYIASYLADNLAELAHEMDTEHRGGETASLNFFD